MIIGRGLLANALKEVDQENYLFYANGISNSVLENIPRDNFEVREVCDIAKEIKSRTFVYFSTIQVNSQENHHRPYVIHKLKMEELVKELFPDYVIVRTSNLVGRNRWNTHTLFNFLYDSLHAQTEINIIESATRNILDVDDFILLFQYYLVHFETKNTTRDIVNPVSYSMAEILAEFENVFTKKFRTKHLPISIAYFHAPCEFSSSLVKSCQISLDNYLKRIINKYYLTTSKSESGS